MRHSSNPVVAEAPNDATLDLEISDPVAILNEIAARYESTERILMEYVDNALDDAEDLYRANAEAYPRKIKIEVIIDARHRSVTVRDNCRGMPQATLERIVRKVGESQKRGITWVNGRFGFGVHAFRAAADAIHFRTKHTSDQHLELHLQRDQSTGIRRPWTDPNPFPTDTGTGTEVTIGPVDDQMFESVSVDSVRGEIERHFEGLLGRRDLLITVSEVGESPTGCTPFDYLQLGGEEFQRTIHVELGNQIYPVEVHLKVADVEVPDRMARFFARGRRINEVAEIKSFIRKSRHRTSVWGHPHLLGYIEVGELARPAITRDDFDRNRGRTALYEAILEIEGELKEALERVNEAHRDNTLSKLEDVLRTVLNGLAKQDRLRLREELTRGTQSGAMVPGGGAEEGTEGGPEKEETKGEGKGGGSGEGGDTGPDPNMPGGREGTATEGQQVQDDPSQSEGARRRRTGFDIKFSSFPPDSEGHFKRSLLIDGTIFINTGHPDFRDRMAETRTGQPKFTDRIGAYLAATVSIHYKDQFYLRYRKEPDRREQMFDEMVEFMCRLESALRPYLPLLQQEFGTNGGADDE
jgi:hypothetical protein